MSKKNFLSNMDTLFEGFSTEAPKKAAVPEVRVREEKQSEKSGSRKGAGLDALFQDAISAGMNRPRRKRTPLPKSGLNSLIRETVESGKVTVEYGARKRVTFLFEKEKLEKLKSIAREENEYLKDILSRIVGEYLDSRKDEE